MNLSAVIEILQIGIVGLAFLLAFMAFKLLREQGGRKEPNANILHATSKYMTFSLLLALISVSGQGLNTYLKSQPSYAEGKVSDEVLVLINDLNRRIDGIRLRAEHSNIGEFGCGGTSKVEKDTLTVMYGSRDGTSCGVSNQNFYKQLSLSIPD
ncbi:hypothetical protein A6K25_13375 [Alteromonas stellipolaris]|jgi:hypothetical protein|uniref:hypothetical protein n=1 Tax=Alteromonas stellipolaris TaxID=233316 RepID=UPI0007B42B60|nr:hypothetical protein [Alteromonas stellipolaris]ANB22177.1 hypothetical protein A6K25_13375 [Alteromonas stellipolaris]